MRVAFYAGAALVGEAFTPPFTASWSGAAGTYVLTAQATDADGATTTGAPRTVHLNPGPTVALTAPANGAVFVRRRHGEPHRDRVGRPRRRARRVLRGHDARRDRHVEPVRARLVQRPRRPLRADGPRGRHDRRFATVSAPVTIDVVTVLSAAADSYVRDNSGGNDNFGSSTALETRTGSSGANRWTYLRFNIGSVPSVQAARLRLFGNLTTTTSVAVQTRVFSSTNVTWCESSIVWNNKPAPGTTVLASVPLVRNSTTARWYEWDLTAFLAAEKAAGRTAVTIVLKNDVATSPHATFRSRQAASNRPELQVTP